VKLEAEQREVERRLVAQPAVAFDLDQVREEIEVMVHDLRTLLEGGDGRAVLKRLLGDERLRLRPDPERGFAVEGEFVARWSRRCVSGGLQRFWGSGDRIRHARDVLRDAPVELGGVAGTRFVLGENRVLLPWSWAAQEGSSSPLSVRLTRWSAVEVLECPVPRFRQKGIRVGPR